MRNARLLTAAVMGLALGLITGPTDAYQSSGAGVVTAVSGPVSMIRASAEPQALKFRDQLQWRDVVETKKDGITRILLLGKTSVTVRELSRLELREEALAAGKKYTVSVVAGKVRATVERSLMGKGDEVEVHSPNAVAAVRGTDFVVEIQDQPARAQAFGLLASLHGGPLLAQAPTGLGTLVYTLTGQVDVTNPRAAARVTVQLGALQGARVQGTANPVRFTFTRLEIPNIVRDLNPPAPPAARRPVASDTAKGKAEQVAAVETTRAGERPGTVTPGGPAVPSARAGDQPSSKSPGSASASTTTGGTGVAATAGGGKSVSSGGRGGGGSLTSSISSGASFSSHVPKVTITKELRVKGRKKD